MASEIPFLTDLQLAILRILWHRGRATAAEITEALRPERQLAQSTVATILSRLEKRGVLSHELRARQFVYHPRISQPETERSMVAELTERLFDGDPAALVSHLLTGNQFSRADLERVKAMIAEHQGTKERRR
jgi:predicted transcriptional regulator